MLNEHLLRQWSAVNQGRAPEVNPEVVELGRKLRLQGVLDNPYGIPAGEPAKPASDTFRVKILRGLAAFAITLALFGAGIGALVAPAPALAVAPHMIFE